MNYYTIAKIEKGIDRVVGFLSAQKNEWLHPSIQKGIFKALRAAAEIKLEELNFIYQEEKEKYYFKLMAIYSYRIKNKASGM